MIDRIVSLVPSETYNVVRLGAARRLVGRTRYCVEPAGLDVPAVGGTKNVHIDKVLALRPQLVLANQEENSRDDITRLRDANVPLLVSFPKTVAASLEHVLHLASLLGTDAEGAKLVTDCERLLNTLPQPEPDSGLACFVPIWRKPWMSINHDTYVADVLALLGLRTIFAGWPSQGPDGRDTRYPVVDLQQVVERQPHVVLLPSEPYPFADKHRGIFLELDTPASRRGHVLCIDGKNLTWHGLWALRSLPQLHALLQSAGVERSGGRAKRAAATFLDGFPAGR